MRKVKLFSDVGYKPASEIADAAQQMAPRHRAGCGKNAEAFLKKQPQKKPRRINFGA